MDLDSQLIGGAVAIGTALVGYGALTMKVREHATQLPKLWDKTEAIGQEVSEINLNLAVIKEKVTQIHENCVRCSEKH